MLTEITIEVSAKAIVIVIPALDFRQEIPNSVLCKSVSSHEFLDFGVTEEMLNPQELDSLKQHHPGYQFAPWYSPGKFDWHSMLYGITYVLKFIPSMYSGNLISRMLQGMRSRYQISLVLPEYDVVPKLRRLEFERRVLRLLQVDGMAINGKEIFWDDRQPKKPDNLTLTVLSTGIVILAFTIMCLCVFLFLPFVFLPSANTLALLISMPICAVVGIAVGWTLGAIVWGVVAKKAWDPLSVYIFLIDFLQDQNTPKFVISFILCVLALDKISQDYGQ